MCGMTKIERRATKMTRTRIEMGHVDDSSNDTQIQLTHCVHPVLPPHTHDGVYSGGSILPPCPVEKRQPPYPISLAMLVIKSFD